MSYCLINNPNEPIEVVVLKSNGDFVGFYNSIFECSKKLNISYNSAQRCIIGKQVSTGGFIILKKATYNPNVKITISSLIRKRKFKKHQPDSAKR